MPGRREIFEEKREKSRSRYKGEQRLRQFWNYTKKVKRREDGGKFEREM